MEKAECMEAAAGTVGSDDSAEIGPGAEPADIPCGARVKKSRSEGASETREKRRRNSKGHGAYWCPDCEYVTKHRGHYRCHLITHTTEKPYTCTECQMGFNRKSNLVRHKYSHSKQKPLLCPGCPLRFKARYNLNRHILFKHVKEAKPCVCETCGKRLSRPDALTRHQRIHTDKKAYSCSVCSRTFGYRHVVKKHEKTMHGAPPAASPRETAASPQGEEEKA